MEKCPLCGGEKEDGKTTYSVDLNFGVVVVRNVPAKICSQCGEEWIEHDVSKQLEKVIDTARQSHSQVEILSFQPVPL